MLTLSGSLPGADIFFIIIISHYSPIGDILVFFVKTGGKASKSRFGELSRIALLF